MPIQIIIPQVDFYTRALVGILGIAFPILFQLIARLDEKYASTQIVEMFNKELENIWFIRSLKMSLMAVVVWTFKFAPLFYTGRIWADDLIENSADLIVFGFTGFALIMFFLYVKKIYIYYTPSEFVGYLIKKHKKDFNNLSHLEALGDVFAHSIKKANYKLCDTIIRFLSGEYARVRNTSEVEPITFPDIHYKIIYNSIEELASQNLKRNPGLEQLMASQGYIIGDPFKNIISEESYTRIWHNLLLCVRFKNDEMIIYYWEHTHQIANNRFKSYANSSSGRVREDIKSRFLEFHIVLGALLLYSRRYDCLNRILKHTIDQPPTYDLLPHGPDTIFFNFAKFIDPYDVRLAFISFRYPFPETNGIGGDVIVKNNICLYLTLIFLKQYSLQKFYTFEDHLRLPTSPNTQAEKRFWIDNLDYFERLVNENLENRDLQKILKYDFMNEEWCKNNHVQTPKTYIIKLREQLERDYAATETGQVLSQDKVSMFVESSKRNLRDVYYDICRSSNENDLTGEFKFGRFIGLSVVGDKDPFAEDSAVTYLNFDSALSEGLKRNIIDFFTSSFLNSTNNKYVLEKRHIFSALNNMSLDTTDVLICFGINFQYYIQTLKVAGLSESMFRQTPIISYPFRCARESCIFVLKKSDLPKIKSLPIEMPIREKLSLVPFDADSNFYSSVIDFNKADASLLEEYARYGDKSKLLKSVLQSLIFTIEIQWNINAEVIQVAEFSQYLQHGFPNNVDDVIRKQDRTE